jgi:uncharacterized protein YecE (DUF72 family)
MPRFRIGCSGFLYDSWKGAFYPENLPHKYWLTFYMQKFNTVELNVTFYRLLKKEAFERWYKETPPGFTFEPLYLSRKKTQRCRASPCNIF